MPEEETITTEETPAGTETTTTETPAATPEADKTAEKTEEVIDDTEEPEKYETAPTIKKADEKATEETEIPEEDQKTIEKVVEKKYGPLFKSIEAQAEAQHKIRVESDLTKILTDNPEFKPYEAKIRKFVEHPNRAEFIKNGLPVKVVVNEAIAPYLQKIGAEKAKAADTKANTIKVNGEQKGSETKGKVDYASMTADQIREMGEQVKSGRYTAGA